MLGYSLWRSDPRTNAEATIGLTGRNEQDILSTFTGTSRTRLTFTLDRTKTVVPAGYFGDKAMILFMREVIRAAAKLGGEHYARAMWSDSQRDTLHIELDQITLTQVEQMMALVGDSFFKKHARREQLKINNRVKRKREHQVHSVFEPPPLPWPEDTRSV